MEKEQSYKDAAENYEVAWRMENESNLAIGYLKQKKKRSNNQGGLGFDFRNL